MGGGREGGWAEGGRVDRWREDGLAEGGRMSEGDGRAAG